MAIASTRKARIALLVALCCAAFGTLTAAAGAKTIGTVPPANPRHNCDTTALTSEQWTVTSIDRCRAEEGVGPVVLPRNWGALSPAQKLLVLIDLERVNRGLPAILGLSPALNKLAAQGAAKDADPGFPARGFTYGGSVWAGTDTVFEADYGWMYDDGYGAVHINVDCTHAGASGCWGHRDNVLMDRAPGGAKLPAIVGGGAYKHGRSYDSYAFEMLAGYSRKHMTFTWASELKHFASAPTLEPLRKPQVKSISPRKGPARGGTAVKIDGTNLQSLTALNFGATKGALLKCQSNRRCTVVAPKHAAGTVKLTAVNHAGKSAAVAAARFTYTA